MKLRRQNADNKNHCQAWSVENQHETLPEFLLCLCHRLINPEVSRLIAKNMEEYIAPAKKVKGLLYPTTSVGEVLIFLSWAVSQQWINH